MDDSIKKPNFFIIGAPKCGTTSLSKYLGEHSNVFFSVPKEPNYFDTDLSNVGRFNTKEDYLELFEGADNYKAVGEGTVTYLYSKDAVPNILKFNPEAKFIVMVRDPVKMFHSLHQQELRSLNENVKDPQKAWNLQEKRRKGAEVPFTCRRPSLLQYGEVCKVGKQIKKLLNTVPLEDKVKIIEFKRFKNSTKEVYEEVLDFLELESDKREDFPVYNANEEISFRSIEVFKRYFLSQVYNGFRLVFEKIKKSTGTDNWNVFEWNYKKNKKGTFR